MKAMFMLRERALVRKIMTIVFIERVSFLREPFQEVSLRLKFDTFAFRMSTLNFRAEDNCPEDTIYSSFPQAATLVSTCRPLHFPPPCTVAPRRHAATHCCRPAPPATRMLRPWPRCRGAGAAAHMPFLKLNDARAQRRAEWTWRSTARETGSGARGVFAGWQEAKGRAARESGAGATQAAVRPAKGCCANVRRRSRAKERRADGCFSARMGRSRWDRPGTPSLPLGRCVVRTGGSARAAAPRVLADIAGTRAKKQLVGRCILAWMVRSRWD